MWTILNNPDWDKLHATHAKELWPDGNKSPANFRQVSEADFCNSHYYTGYSYTAIGYFQFTRLNDDKTKLDGWVIGNLYINSFGKGWLLQIGRDKVHYWLFDLCQHQYETTKPGKCYWEGKC